MLTQQLVINNNNNNCYNNNNNNYYYYYNNNKATIKSTNSTCVIYDIYYINIRNVIFLNYFPRRNYFYAYGCLHLCAGNYEEWCLIIKQMSGTYTSVNRAAVTFAVQLSLECITTHSIRLCVTKF